MQINREMEAKMIMNPDKWPGETLCLKRNQTSRERDRSVGITGLVFGVLTNSRLPLIVYLRPNFIQEQRYDSVDALLDDGWIVD